MATEHDQPFIEPALAAMLAPPPPLKINRPAWVWCEHCSKRRAIKTTSTGHELCDRCSRNYVSAARGKTVPVGRNQLCPCGSRNKWKKCCGAVVVQPTSKA